MEATVGCQSNGRTWRLVCRGTSWLGDVGNCSGDDALAGARLPTMTSAAYHIGNDVDQTAVDFASSLPTGDVVHTTSCVLRASVNVCSHLSSLTWLPFTRHNCQSSVSAISTSTDRRHDWVGLSSTFPISWCSLQRCENCMMVILNR